MCFVEGQASESRYIPTTGRRPTACSAPLTPPCTSPSTPSATAPRCPTACIRRSSIPKSSKNKSAPIQTEPARFPPLQVSIRSSAHVQLRDRHLALDQLRLAPLALFVQSHPAALFPAIVPILVEL